MEKNKLKSNKGMTMTDVIIAIVILCIFAGVVGNLYYQIVLNNNLIRFNAIAVYHVVRIAEDIDKMSYDDVTTQMNENIKEDYEIPEMFNINVKVENYNEIDKSKEDIIKIVTITAEYEVLGQKKQYEIKKLKIKEM